MRIRRRKAPDWADFNESDPGITLPNLFAFLTEPLLRRRKLAVATLVLVALWKLRADRSE